MKREQARKKARNQAKLHMLAAVVLCNVFGLGLVVWLESPPSNWCDTYGDPGNSYFAANCSDRSAEKLPDLAKLSEE